MRTTRPPTSSAKTRRISNAFIILFWSGALLLLGTFMVAAVWYFGGRDMDVGEMIAIGCIVAVYVLVMLMATSEMWSHEKQMRAFEAQRDKSDGGWNSAEE